MNNQIADNYKEILTVAKRITPKHHKELINETYIAVHHITPPENSNEFIKWFSKCMSNLNNWSNSSFNKSIKINANQFGYDVLDEEPNEPINPLDVKEFLEMHEKHLFHLHFELKLSARQIANLLEQENGTKENYQSYQRMINIMKIKINKWKQSILLA